MRGELFEPGGDSRTPISAAAVATIRWATPPAAPGMTRAAAPTPPAVPGTIAPWSIDANGDCAPVVLPPVVAAPLAGGGGVAGAVGPIGASAALISEMRMMAV
jgi:hypothetical protein